MSQSEQNVLSGHQRSSWIRLRTLILLRWVAIAGQLIALVVAQELYGLRLEAGWCYLAVGISIIGNLVATFAFPENKRLPETANLCMIMFDLLQLSFLLFLTGGLNNPFALLLLGPVSSSAAVLRARSMLLVGGSAIIIVTLLGFYHLPLQTVQGFVLRIPGLFVFGNWLALVIAIVFFSVSARRVTSEINVMSDALYATQLALSREQKLTDLGGVVAAAAHEFGTPLATIKLASSELMDELEDRPDLQEDARLIREQADRCRDILRDMGRTGKSDAHMQQAPLMSLLQEAAEPHENRGKRIHYALNPGADGDLDQPTVLRQPGIIHALRNLIQNSVDFAKSEVWIEANWTETKIVLRIMDDGPGFPANLLGRIGDPFIRQRKVEKSFQERPEYEGMGLGLFIAKTLIERSGADVTFANGSDPSENDRFESDRLGAIVEVTWPRGKIEAHKETGLRLKEQSRITRK